MQARLSAVQHALIVLLVAAIAVAVLARPAPFNGRLRRALAELEQFAAQFDRAQVEGSLLEYARAQGRRPLSELASATTGKRVPKLTAASGGVEPLASIQVASLADVKHFAAAGSSLPIGSAELAALGPALAWRLARTADPEEPATLASVELRAASDVTSADLELEPQVAALRLEQLTASAAVSDATKKLEVAEQLLEQRRKWKLPWKVISKSDEARKAAKAALEEQRRSLRDVETRYESAVKRAERPHTIVSIPPIPEYGVAHVVVQQAGQARAYDLPAKLAVRSVPVPSLGGGELREVEVAGLWPEVQHKTATEAIASVRAHFNWHYRYVELAGLKLGGMTLLQIVPCVLPLLLYFVLVRMRAVARTYNPFGTRVTAALPRVGFGGRLLDGLVLIGLPLTAAGCAAASLLLVGQVPALPVIAAVACLLLGGYAFVELGELQNLMQDVVRSHSHPPEEPVHEV